TIEEAFAQKHLGKAMRPKDFTIEQGLPARPQQAIAGVSVTILRWLRRPAFWYLGKHRARNSSVLTHLSRNSCRSSAHFQKTSFISCGTESVSKGLCHKMEMPPQPRFRLSLKILSARVCGVSPEVRDNSTRLPSMMAMGISRKL